MATRTEIIDGMQFTFLNGKSALNTSSAAPRTITYQYAGTSAPTDLPTSASYDGWTDFSAAEAATFRAALDHVETLLNVEFVEISGSADPDMNVGKVTIPGSTAGVGGFSASSSGDTITRYDSYVVYDNTIDLTTSVDLVLHEVGHAMGLKHPFSSPTVPSGFDSNKYSIMSYTSNPDNGMDSDAMMLFDILAMQDLWGANLDTASGDSTYTGKRTDTIDAIWDGGGIDTFDASAIASGVRLDLRQARFSSFDSTDDVVIAYDTVIENATGGAGADVLIGNSAANLLLGGGGRDKIKGNKGRDDIEGGDARDKISGGIGFDKISGGNGNDRIAGDQGNDRLSGNAGRDTFVFAEGGGKDRVLDFTDNKDQLKFYHDDVSSVSDVLDLGVNKGANAVFTFNDGLVVVVNDITVAALSDDILVA
ncbi:M10 family metallopeptidase [Roseobacter sp. N2S]|uniref:M10 family metallopeptidase n=1 Tax=Roseobacter sp. N2S TaxID=2663844 RepID=UPI002861845C|nr:M10 family metallopeptidase [Roseobacter sp. N2S]MDR6264565.1 Ca2+-binding RTX toxin-like protein [Roseobacter sp. N2S]